MDNELPVGERTPTYRALEMLPGLLSYGLLAGLVVVSVFSPVAAAWGLLAVIAIMLIKAIRSAFDIMIGNAKLEGAQAVDWHARLMQLEDPTTAVVSEPRNAFHVRRHRRNLTAMARDPQAWPKPSEIYNAVIVAAYNEPYEVIAPSFEALAETTYDNDHLIVLLA